MKKLLLTTSFLALFVLVGTNVSAQASSKVVKEIDSATQLAVAAINKDTSLKDGDKKKFIARIEASAKYAKVNEDSKAKDIFAKEYNRIADNYARITENKLPVVSMETKVE